MMFEDTPMKELAELCKRKNQSMRLLCSPKRIGTRRVGITFRNNIHFYGKRKGVLE